MGEQETENGSMGGFNPRCWLWRWKEGLTFPIYQYSLAHSPSFHFQSQHLGLNPSMTFFFLLLNEKKHRAVRTHFEKIKDFPGLATSLKFLSFKNDNISIYWHILHFIFNTYHGLNTGIAMETTTTQFLSSWRLH